MRATSLSSAGPVRARPRRGCQARTRGSHSPIHKHKTWTKSRGPVTTLISATFGRYKTAPQAYTIAQHAVTNLAWSKDSYQSGLQITNLADTAIDHVRPSKGTWAAL